MFLIQNRGWESLEDGSRHELAVQLDGGSKFEFDAVAKTELDSDGPGLMFAVPPGEADGARFIAEFAKAGGMAVGEGGEAIASVRLTGGGSAMTELAQCMSRLWSGGATAQQGKRPTAIGAGTAIKLRVWTLIRTRPPLPKRLAPLKKSDRFAPPQGGGAG